jgi:putative YphP/YqiW family bacilliredoxin
MMYDEQFIGPMRAEITQLGVEECRTAASVDEALKGTAGTQLMIVNSMCGCAARNMRPAVGLALQHPATPDRQRRGRHATGA